MKKFFLVMECSKSEQTPVYISVDEPKAYEFALEKSKEKKHLSYFIYYQVGDFIYNSGVYFENGTKGIIISLDTNAEYILVEEFFNFDKPALLVSKDFDNLYKQAKDLHKIENVKRISIHRRDLTNNDVKSLGEFFK